MLGWPSCKKRYPSVRSIVDASGRRRATDGGRAAAPTGPTRLQRTKKRPPPHFARLSRTSLANLPWPTARPRQWPSCSPRSTKNPQKNETHAARPVTLIIECFFLPATHQDHAMAEVQLRSVIRQLRRIIVSQGERSVYPMPSFSKLSFCIRMEWLSRC